MSRTPITLDAVHNLDGYEDKLDDQLQLNSCIDRIRILCHDEVGVV